MTTFTAEPLNIGLDARTVFAPKPRGTGRNLRDAYSLLSSEHRDWAFKLYHRAATPEGLEHSNIARPRLQMPGERWKSWFNLRLPLAAWMDQLDLLHLPANVGLTYSPVPTIVTIHDLVPLHDQDASKLQRQKFESGIRRALNSAVRIICPSTATRDELARHFGYSPENVSVIPWAADQRIAEQLVTVHDLERIQRHYGLDRPWLLNFSGSSSRKNAAGIINALAHIPKKNHDDFVVVLVGCEPQANRDHLQALADELGVSHLVRLHEYTPHEDLAPLLRGASGLMLPSFCEGFGLPILDAFACDTPVLTSNQSSLPEVAGDAAVYCDPRDHADIADAMIQILDLQTAVELRQAGTARLKNFSWSQTAHLMANAFCEAVAASRVDRSFRPLTPAHTREAS